MENVSTVEPAMSSHSYEQPSSYPHNDILYTNEPPMSSHLPQGWLLIAGSTVLIS